MSEANLATISPAERFPTDSPILVVEGDPQGKGKLTRILNEFQLKNVAFIEDYFKGLHKGRFEAFSLILISQSVLKGDGLTLLGNLRDQGKNTKSPIIFMQHTDDAEVKKEAEGAGASAVVTKPLEEEPFRKRLEEILGKQILTRKVQSALEHSYSAATSAAIERGKSLLAIGNLQGAETAFEEALVTAAGSDEVYCGLAEVYVSRGDKESAEKVLVEAERIDPEIRDKFRLREISLLARARENFERGNHEQAKNEFEGAAFANEQSIDAYAGLGEALILLGDAAGADAAFEKALSIKNPFATHHVYNRIAISSRLSKNYEHALRAYDKALAIDPKDHILYYNKAIVFVAQNQFQEALEFLEKALEMKPSFPYAQNAKRIILTALKSPLMNLSA